MIDNLNNAKSGRRMLSRRLISTLQLVVGFATMALGTVCWQKPEVLSFYRPEAAMCYNHFIHDT